MVGLILNVRFLWYTYFLLKPLLTYVKNFSIQICLHTIKHTARVNLHPVYPGHVCEGHPDGHGHHRVGLVMGVESDTGSWN